MKSNEIERAMREERHVTPSQDFTARVMRSVRAEADASQGLEFPWRYLTAGLAACTVLIVVGVLSGSRGIDLDALAAAMPRSSTIQTLSLVPMLLAGSLGVVWSSMRLAGYRR